MADLPPNWKKSEKSVRAIQVAFEFNKSVSDAIRTEAGRNGLSTSDQIRDIIGLQPKKPQRPRLTVSLSTEDYLKLGERYDRSPDDKRAIRQAIADELMSYSEQHGATNDAEN